MSPRILLLRHGQIIANRQRRWHGSTDSSLTLRGRWQAYLTGRFLSKNEHINAVYTSPLQRCRHTAKLAAGHAPVQHEIVPEIAEMSVGAWEGMAFNELNDRHKLIERCNQDLDWAPPGGESLSTVAKRMRQGLVAIADRHAESDTVLVVSHGAAMAIALGELLHQDPRSWVQYHFENCSLTEIRLGSNPSLEVFNSCAHRKPFS